VSGSAKIPPEAMAAADEYLDVLYDGRNWRESFWPAGKGRKSREVDPSPAHRFECRDNLARIIAKHHAPLREALAECVSAFAQLTNRGGKRGQLACRMGDKCSAALGEG